MSKDGRSCVALIPARGGSKRVPRKNVRLLNGHPLIAYSIASARQSGVFSAVVVSTDDPEIAVVARKYGAETPFLRPTEIAGEFSPDIEWVRHALTALAEAGRTFDCFSILRPTSPLRTAETIQRAWRQFGDRMDSLRAVEKCAQHPGKMWVVRDGYMLPLLPFSTGDKPWHSSQYQSLPEIYVQNASLEIAWTRVVEQNGSIAGAVIAPFLTDGCEGADVNTEYDWHYVEHLVASGAAVLPEIVLEGGVK